MFICLEGIDGAGKTTQSRMLVENLNAAGKKAIQVADPGTTPLGKAIRELVLDRDEPIHPLAQMLLFSSARAELSQFIRERLKENLIVVCDRWILSTLVYQSTGNDIDADFIMRVFKETSAVPDLCFVLDIAPEKAEQRRAPSKDRFESRPIEDKRRMRQAYIEYAGSKRECAAVTYVLNADVPQDVMQQAIFSMVEQHLVFNGRKNA